MSGDFKTNLFTGALNAVTAGGVVAENAIQSGRRNLNQFRNINNAFGAKATAQSAGRSTAMAMRNNPTESLGAIAGGGYGMASDDTSIIGGAMMGGGMAAVGKRAYSGFKNTKSQLDSLADISI